MTKIIYLKCIAQSNKMALPTKNMAPKQQSKGIQTHDKMSHTNANMNAGLGQKFS